jgi:hypothetical protein
VPVSQGNLDEAVRAHDANRFASIRVGVGAANGQRTPPYLNTTGARGDQVRHRVAEAIHGDDFTAQGAIGLAHGFGRAPDARLEEGST